MKMPEEKPELKEVRDLMLELKRSVSELKADQKATEAKVGYVMDCVQPPTPPPTPPTPPPQPPPPPPSWGTEPIPPVRPYPAHGYAPPYYPRWPSECCRICDVAGSFVITYCTISRVSDLRICGLAGKDLANQEVEIFVAKGFCNIKLIGKDRTDANGKFGIKIEDIDVLEGQILVVRIDGDVACTKVLPR